MCVFDLLYIQSLGPFKYYISHPQGGGVCHMLILAYGGEAGSQAIAYCLQRDGESDKCWGCPPIARCETITSKSYKN